MIICLKTRLDEIHIISWTTTRGQHYTVCGKMFSSKNHVETFAADNNFRGICPNCYAYQESNDLEIAEGDAREIRPNPTMSSSLGAYMAIQKGWESMQDKFEDTLDRRYWPKKTRMRRKFPTEEVRTKKRRNKSHGQSVFTTHTFKYK